MQARGLLDSTMIVFTSDHGDYLGDHWLGEKELFHEPSVRIPLIVVDPRSAADATRGTVSDALVESIDLAPTFVEAFGGAPKPHVLEGRSLTPLLHGGEPDDWRQYVVSEYDYALRRARLDLGVPVADCRMDMIMDRRWKYVHAEHFRPMLYDLEADPQEFRDLGADPAHEAARARLHEALFAWARRHHNRITISDAAIAQRHGSEVRRGILIGYWDEAERDAAKPAPPSTR
jgi:arylsulfatase A-like enzyme